MTDRRQRTINILTAIFESADEMVAATGIKPDAAAEIMRTGELRLNEYAKIKQTLGLKDERIFFLS